MYPDQNEVMIESASPAWINNDQISHSASRSFHIDFKVRALAILLLVPALSFLGRHVKVDDAFIYARYVANALAGHGLVFNVGEHVNALTSILDTWLLLGSSSILRGHVLLAQTILGASFLLVAALVAEDMVPFAGIFIAANSYFYFCNGMETSLFLLMLVLCVRAYVSDRINWLPTLCALATLTRFEGGAMAVVVIWQLWRRRRWPALWSLVPPVLLAVFYLVFNFHFYSAMLPQSAAAKIGQGTAGFWGAWPTAFLNIPKQVLYPITGSRLYAILLIVLAGYGSRDKRLSRSNQVVVPFLLILGAFYILFNIPPYLWYYGPFVYFLTIYACRLLPETRAAYLSAAFVAICLAQASVLYLHRKGLAPKPYEQLAYWIDANTPPDSLIATSETGTIGWYCRHPIIDMVGLTTPQNAIYTAHGDFSSWFKARPDYVVVHPAEPFPWEVVALQSSQYQYAPVHFGDVYLLRRK